MSSKDAHFLRRLVGTKVTTFLDLGPRQEGSLVSSSTATLTTATSSASTLSFSGSPVPVIPRISYTWFVTEKLTERAVYLSQLDVDSGVGSPMTDADLATLAQQIQPPEVCGELEAFKLLMSQGCNCVPRFLGYCKRQQGKNEFVPGGYAKYLVWEKVPGDSLTVEYYWTLDPFTRKDIRQQRIAAMWCETRALESPRSFMISPQATFVSRDFEWHGQSRVLSNG
ncbi:hypothetical protein PEBR_10690 [Penicillium brasilianum]|uniref:Uncharacterized protein n=1 Tax=Penicillium brasilianum TaxID=104259 RepID=A0A1S9RUD6_PENBI|nr:hypothetical protein PEBR_10690 [Penicillium brasilianum]